MPAEIDTYYEKITSGKAGMKKASNGHARKHTLSIRFRRISKICLNNPLDSLTDAHNSINVHILLFIDSYDTTFIEQIPKLSEVFNMSFFSKPEYIELDLPFEYIDDIEDSSAGLISLESSVDIEGARKYCYATFVISQKYIDETDNMVALLRIPHEKTIKVTLKFKDGKYKDFKFDLDSLADAYFDERFRRMDLVCWGLNDKPATEFREG